MKAPSRGALTQNTFLEPPNQPPSHDEAHVRRRRGCVGEARQGPGAGAVLRVCHVRVTLTAILNPASLHPPRAQAVAVDAKPKGMLNYTQYSDDTCTTVSKSTSWRVGSCAATINRLVECDAATANVTWYASAGCTGNITEKDSYVVGKCNSVSKKQSVQVRARSCLCSLGAMVTTIFQRSLRSTSPLHLFPRALKSTPSPSHQVVCIPAAAFDETE